MKIQRLVIALTAVNVVFLLLLSAQLRSTTAQTVPTVLRARTLELVDERGVVRARLGVKAPSTVVELDLFDKNGINHVKLGAGDSGSGLLLTDEATTPLPVLTCKSSPDEPVPPRRRRPPASRCGVRMAVSA